MGSFWSDKRVVVTGGAGFLGSVVVAQLRALGCSTIVVPRSQDYDLVEMSDVKRLYNDAAPDLIIHLAARVGGIGANQANAGKFFYDNLMMGTQLMEVGRQRRLQKFVALATICAYPKFTPVPFKEDDLWLGYPEETNAAYGLAKKMLLVQSQAYRQQYGFNSIVLFPVNLYGPGDKFDLNASHVIPAFIRKAWDAKRRGEQDLVIWGTGTPRREFLHVDDCADACIHLMKTYDGDSHINVGSGKDVTILELAKRVSDIVGFNGGIKHDLTKPDGAPRKLLSVEKLKALGWISRISLLEGLKETVSWFQQHEVLVTDDTKVRT